MASTLLDEMEQLLTDDSKRDDRARYSLRAPPWRLMPSGWELAGHRCHLLLSPKN